MDDGERSARIPRIGILSPVTEHGMRDWWKELVRGLHELGYVEGRNVEFVWRFGDGKFERLAALANELAQLGVDVIMPATPPAIYAAKSASSSIPIVFPLGSDPVETGLVSNLEHPGANVTGMATMSRLQSQPRLALVRECLPTAKCVALIKHTANPALNLQVDASNAAASELALKVLVLEFAAADEIEQAFEAAAAQRVDAVLPLSDPMALGNAERIGALSLRYKIPVVSPFREITDVGGLLSYGPDLSMLFRRSASLVDQILKGAKPGALPIGKLISSSAQTCKRRRRSMSRSLLRY